MEALLERIAARHSPAALASSMQAEDMVLVDAIARARLPIEVFVLDTGRLHAETLQLVGEIEARYGIGIAVCRPDEKSLSQYTSRHGRDAFYESTELRLRCCEIRKVEPLRRALAGKGAWITGQRRAQADSRASLPEREFDLRHGIWKFNPLADWSEEQVWAYLDEHRVPVHRLYREGYRSIGCAPCTRPTLPGEHPRAGRWWWEIAEKKECGLHVG